MAKYKFQNVTPVRSKTMKAIKSKNTSIEIILRKKLFKKGFRYRIHYDKIIGNPDIVFVKKKIAIFCDSEFWHGKNWDIKKNKIKNNRDYWIPKIEKTIKRDKNITVELEILGWKVLRFWESDIINDTDKIICTIIKAYNDRK